MTITIVLLKTKWGQDLSRFLGQLHGSSSRQLNLWDGVTGRQVWHNYWDTCIRSEEDMWQRFNYIHQNPVKHGYVQQIGDWPFSILTVAQPDGRCCLAAKN